MRQNIITPLVDDSIMLNSRIQAIKASPLLNNHATLEIDVLLSLVLGALLASSNEPKQIYVLDMFELDRLNRC